MKFTYDLSEDMFDKLFNTMLLLFMFTLLGFICYAVVLSPSIKDCKGLGKAYGAIHTSYTYSSDSCAMVLEGGAVKVVTLEEALK